MNGRITWEGAAFAMPGSAKAVFMGSGFRPLACPGMTEALNNKKGPVAGALSN